MLMHNALLQEATSGVPSFLSNSVDGKILRAEENENEQHEVKRKRFD